MLKVSNGYFLHSLHPCSLNWIQLPGRVGKEKMIFPDLAVLQLKLEAKKLLYCYSAEHCGCLKKETCGAVLCLVHPLPPEPVCHSAQGLLVQHRKANSKGRKKHSKGSCRPDSATFEPWSSAVLRELQHSLWQTGGSPQPCYNNSFSQVKSREQEKWDEVIFPAPPAKLKILFKWELSPEPSDRNLFELRVNQKQF